MQIFKLHFSRLQNIRLHFLIIFLISKGYFFILQLYLRSITMCYFNYDHLTALNVAHHVRYITYNIIDELKREINLGV